MPENATKRVRDPLASTGHERRYAERSQNRTYYFNRQRASNPSPTKECNVRTTETSPRKPRATFHHAPPPGKKSRLTGDAAADRRSAIKYVFQGVLRSPPKDEWEKLETIKEIIETLRMPPGSWGVVQSVLLALDEDPKCDVRREAPGKGRRALIQDFTPQAEFIYKALQGGNSIGTVTFLLNNCYRRKLRLPNLSYSSVQRFVTQSPVVVLARRKTKKSGTDDADAKWSQARLAFAQQLHEQVELGTLSDEERAARLSTFPPLYLRGIAWWDEHHKKVVFGHTSDIEARIYRDPATGLAATKESGGVLSAEMPNTTVKFPPEARMLFGVAMIENAQGVCCGVKAEPFSYTGRQVVGFSAYEKACEAERRRCLALQRPYDVKKKYAGAAYEQEMRDRMYKKKIICVKELIDHVIAESTRMYAGTKFAKTFFIFHDGLTAWWEPEAQAYIKKLNFQDRQLRSLPPTNAGTRYAFKLPGNSPEICRGLDSFGFAHLQRSVKLHTSLTSVLKADHPCRFNMGTVHEVESTLRRVWTVAPTSEQIVADIQGFPHVVQKIIDARGCVVPDEDFRGGRRELRKDGKGKLAGRKRSRSQIATNTDLILHADCQPALLHYAVGGLTAIQAYEEEAEVENYVTSPDDEAMRDASEGAV